MSDQNDKQMKSIEVVDVDVDKKTSGGVVILQWLAYAFWFWFVVSTVWLAGVVINFAVAQKNTDDWAQALAYPLAAVIIMLIIAFVTDFFYARQEPEKKTGAAYVIMLLHVVPFVLIGIGSLVTIVFTIITMALNNDPIAGIDGPLKVMLTAIVAFVLFVILAVRAFFGSRRVMLRKAAWVLFGLMALGFIIGAIAGPAAEASRTKQDRLIETALPSLSDDIRSYTAQHNKLPGSLTDVTHMSSNESAAVQKIIDQRLVTYKPNTLPAEDGNSSVPGDDYKVKVSTPTNGTGVMPVGSAKRYYYQLCTAFTTEKKNQYAYSSPKNDYYTTDTTSTGSVADYRYSSVYSIASHPKGQVCYNLFADGDYNYDVMY